MIISDAIAATFDDRVFPGGLTYSGHPLACASVVATIDAMREEGIVENAGRDRQQTCSGPGLRRAGRAAPGDRRGARARRVLGARPGVDRQTRAMLAPYGGVVAGDERRWRPSAARAGLLPFTNYNRLHVVPPCTITEAEAKEGLAILDEALTEVDAYYQG